MDIKVNLFISTIILGLGATLTFDLWALFLKHAFKIKPSNMCMIGRWVRYMPDGIFKHENITTTPPKSMECEVGWVTHYLTGIVFATGFVVLAGKNWLQHPTLIPALIFSIVTVLAPFFIMQPALGHGVAASKTSNPIQSRLRTVMNHISFGFGLYLFGLLTQWLL
ncbi:MAG: DUF2938 domain-containing protein [Chloroflexi bacterium]|nr:DUF2938 domain-containing protein [Chloroflexota bacterium]